MLNTYIKNRGSTKTIIHNNNHNAVNQLKWDADYDGNEANISVDLINNGKVGHYDVKLDNDDLAKILNVNSVKTPIHKRLKDDFKKARFHKDPSMYNIYLDDFKLPALRPIAPMYMNKEPDSVSLNSLITKYNPTVSLDPQTLDPAVSLDPQTLDPAVSFEDQLLQIAAPNHSHFSSPLTDEELIIPLTIDKDSNLLGKHKTHRVYKHHINSAAKGLKKSKSKRKTKGKTRRKHRKIEDKLRTFLHI